MIFTPVVPYFSLLQMSVRVPFDHRWGLDFSSGRPMYVPIEKWVEDLDTRSRTIFSNFTRLLIRMSSGDLFMGSDMDHLEYDNNISSILIYYVLFYPSVVEKLIVTKLLKVTGINRIVMCTFSRRGF